MGFSKRGGVAVGELKDFWVMFMKDPWSESIHGTAFGHNCVADYRTLDHFIGYKKIKVDMKELLK